MIRHCIALVVCVLSLSQVFGGLPTSWPHERSDISPDPEITWATLPNGLRYAVRPNAEPQGRISLRFLVHVGSLHERENEQGLAHFLEHMAFRSAENHEGGSIVEKLQRLGIGFGPDNTAFTTYDYTIYHLELPNTDPDTLKTAFNVFRIYADGLTFDQDVIDIERGVVLSEMVTRDTPGARAGIATGAFIYPQSRTINRQPIGTEYHIRKMRTKQFEEFYDAWYRPERMLLTVVGEIETETVSDLIEEVFGSLIARGAPRDEPSLKNDELPAADQPLIGMHRDPASVGLGLTLTHVSSPPVGPNNQADLLNDITTALAFNMLQNRISKQSRDRGSSYGNPQVHYGSQLKGWRLSSLSLPTKIMAWRLVVRAADQELRRGLLHGFTETELSTAKKDFSTYYQQAVRAASTMSSEPIATSIANTIAYDQVYSSAQITNELIQPILDAATLESCHEALKAAWGDQKPRLFISAHNSFNTGTDEIAEAYDYSRRIEVLPPVDHGIPTFGYTDFGPKGELLEENYVEDLDLTLTRFANGVRYNFKQTDFEANNIHINLRVGSGRLTLSQDTPGLDYLANYGLLSGGLGKHDSNEMSDILNGHIISLNFSVESDAFVFSANCAPRELTLTLQTLSAILTDNAYRPEAMRTARSGFGSLYEQLNSNPGGPIFSLAPRVMTGGDTRFGVPNYSILYSRTLEELREWVEPAFRHGPIEVSIVGDVDFQTATEAISTTLGALPTREDRDPREADLVAIPRADKNTSVSSIDAKLGQVGVAYYWPVHKIEDVHEERRLGLLGGVVEDRLRKRVREEFGAAYSVTTHFISIDGFPHQNFFTTYTDVEPTRANEISKLIRDEITAMRREGITKDEFERTKQPFLARRKVHLRTNRYWGYTVLRDAQQRDDRLASARDRASDSEAIDHAEIQALLERYFDLTTVFKFQTIPQKYPANQ